MFTNQETQRLVIITRWHMESMINGNHITFFMKTFNLIFKKMIILFIIFISISFVSISFAGWGKGQGNNYHNCGQFKEGMGGKGNGGFHHGRGYNDYSNLSDEEIEKIQKLKTAFFEQTKDLRQNLYAKKLEFEAEFAKKESDEAQLLKLQKEITTLKGDLKEKHVKHMLSLKKINPDIAKQVFRKHARRGRGLGSGKMGGGLCR